MAKQIIFAVTILFTLGVFAYTINRIIGFFRLTKPAFPIRDIPKRFSVMFNVAIGQTKILRFPVIGFIHALVFWGFCLILFGSIEMITDGLSGSEKCLHFLGPLYSFFTASGDIFAVIVGISILVFIVRRVFLHIKRFEGIEMKHVSHLDAKIALSMILFLMVSLSGMNLAYVSTARNTGSELFGVFPFSSLVSGMMSGFSVSGLKVLYEICWWSHILMIFIFANVLPYSKHFHVFMSVPNVFLSRLDPLGKLSNMDSITREVKLMLYPESADPSQATEAPAERFGIRDAEDISWKNYMDSLSCTECGRCTSVCPANITGKRLSPRKIMMDVRARMKVKGPGLIKEGKTFSDSKSLIRDSITEEELWACTTCNACARECPININQPSLIVDMRRYLVMEEGVAPGGLKTVFSNIENNGAPWQYSAEDRLNWAKDLKLNVN